MEEKQYPHIEEEQGMDMACEPVADVAATSRSSVYGITEVHDWIDDLDWDRFPSYGPFSEEEAIKRIERAKYNLSNSGKGIRIDNLHAALKELHPWL